MAENNLNPPDPCSACDRYYAYRDELCWECWHDAQADRAETVADQRRDQRAAEEKA